jgi:O-antigen/teichoic acid export membrane protein
MLWQILAIVTLPILISSVGVEDFGIFSLAAASMGYFGIMSQPARQAIVKFAAQSQNDELEINRVFNSAFVLNIGAGVLMAGILGSLAIYADVIFDVSPGNEGRVAILLCMYAAASVIIQPLAIYGSLLLGFQMYGPIAVFDSIGAVSRVVVILAIWRFDGTIFWYAINELCIEIVRGLVLRLVVKKRYSFVKLRRDYIENEVFVKIFKYGGWTVLYMLSLLVVNQGSRVLVGIILSVSAITYFHVAGMLYNLVNTVSSYIRSAVLPSGAAAMKEGDHVFLEKLIYSGSKLSLCILLPVCIQLAVFSQVIIGVWMGEEFIEHTVVLSQLMILSWLFMIPTFNLIHIYWAQKDISMLSIVAITLAILYIPCTIYLVKHYGLDGVGISIMVFFAVQLPAQLSVISRKIDINIKRYLIKICAPIYIMSMLYGYVVFVILNEAIHIEGLLALFFIFSFSVALNIAVNILLTSRKEGMMLLNKFHHVLTRS